MFQHLLQKKKSNQNMNVHGSVFFNNHLNAENSKPSYRHAQKLFFSVLKLSILYCAI